MDNELQSMPPPSPVDCLVTVCVGGWRFARAYLRAISKLDALDQTKYQGQLRYFVKQIEDNLKLMNMSLVNFEGQPFEPGLPVNAINVGDFTNHERLVVDQMLEPVVMGASGLVRMGLVLLKRVEQ